MTAVDLPGGSGNYVSTPDAAALDIVGDIDVRAKIAPDDWTPSLDQCIISKHTTAGNQRSWHLTLTTTGNLRFSYSVLGTTALNRESTAAVAFTNGTAHWVRATLDVDNGAAGNDIKFYTSEDGTNWTQLGATVTNAGTTAIFASTTPVEVGSRGGGTTDTFTGLVYRAEILNGIAGTVVANPLFDEEAAGTTSFADSTGKTWTLNGTAQIAIVARLAAEEQDVYPPRVLLSLTDLNLGDAVELFRVVGGERTEIRAGSDPDVADPSFVRVDAELPFGVPVTYLATVNETYEVTVGPTTYTLPGGNVALSDAITGAAAEAVILAWESKTYDPQASVFKVGARNVVVRGDMGMFTADIELYLETQSARDNVTDLLRNATSGVIQIRQAGPYDDVDSYVGVLSVTKRRFSADGSDQRRTFIISVAETESWAPALEAAGFTLQDIADAYDGLTLQDLANDYATLLDIAQGDFSS